MPSVSTFSVCSILLICTLLFAAHTVGAVGDEVQDQYCCCSSTELDENAKPLLSVLDELVNLPFFRYFRVNVKKKCPYWVVHVLCMQRGNPCKCGRCEEKHVPESLRTGSDMGKPYDFGDSEEEEEEKKKLEMMQQAEQEHQRQKKNDPALDPAHDKFHDAVSELDDKSKQQPKQQQQQQQAPVTDPDAEYIDLVRNPEANTMYLGDKASRVWRAIYEENCFKVGDGDDEGQCREQRVFYRLISGLHTSISTHIAAYYKYRPLSANPAENDETPEQRHQRRSYATTNCTTFEQRLTNKPHHVANLHFLYRFVIRALTRSRTAFVDPDNNFAMRPALRIGDEAVDAEMQSLLAKLFKAHLLCSPTFNESLLLEQRNVVALVPMMKKMIRNMTTITDCISCEKCRMWGKLQLLGLATAFKIIMAPADSVPPLDRREMMALVNFARQLTDSVHNVRNLCGGASPGAEKKNKNTDL